MNKTEEKRQKIFKVYSQQWELLKQSNLLRGINQKYVGNYICPICLEHFSPKDLNQSLKNPLTLEDAPPKALGGKANTLTCKTCNNTTGSKIDSYLSIRLNDLDKRKFLPNTEAKVKVKMGEDTVQGTVKIEEDGTMKMIHSNKNNHKEKLDEFIKKIDPKSENPVVEIEFLTGKMDLTKLQYALLKSAYMLVFERFGYAFILDPVYDKIREQLLNPDTEIYPTRFWLEAPYPKEMCGVHFVTEEGLESILVIFSLATNHTERIITAILPLPFNSIEKIIEELNFRFSREKSFDIDCYAFDKEADYLRGIEHIKHTLNWIENKGNELTQSV